MNRKLDFSLKLTPDQMLISVLGLCLFAVYLAMNTENYLPGNEKPIKNLATAVTIFEYILFCVGAFLYYKIKKPEVLSESYMIMLYAFVAIIPMLLFNMCAVKELNRLLDFHPDQIHYVQVTNHRITYQASSSRRQDASSSKKYYKLFISSWVKDFDILEIEVSYDEYERFKTSEYCLIVKSKPGLFGLEYYSAPGNYGFVPCDKFPPETKFPLLEKEAIKIMKDYEEKKNRLGYDSSLSEEDEY